MKKITNKTSSASLEKKALIGFLVMFLVVMGSAWFYAMDLRKTVVSNNATNTADPTALIQVEKLKSLVESQMSTARSFFLLGSKFLYDKQKQDKQSLSESLSDFEKVHPLPGVSDHIKNINTLMQQQQDLFDQGMEFREKQTESKIVGQFYQSKASPLVKQIHDHLNEIKELHQAELARISTESKQAASGVEVQIPQGMIWLTGLLTFIISGMSIIIVSVLRERRRQLSERDRLFKEAQQAIQAREEFVSAISNDLKEPLSTLSEMGEYLPNVTETEKVRDCSELIKSIVAEVNNRVKDVCDQKVSDIEGLTLRLDQLNIDEVMDDARVLMSPIAKKKDVRLQVDMANPPVLVFLDRERVLRVMSNLIGNAIKFSPRNGKVSVKVRSDQQYVNISIADSGSGISEKQLSEIFNFHWQARKTADQGAGVGLAVAKTIVESHGGVLKIHSHPGSGTTVTFSLPRRRPAGAQMKRPVQVRYTTSPKPQTDSFL